MRYFAQRIVKLHLLTLLASVTFAANSFLCRLALGDNLIDPASFTALRLLSGTLLLSLFVKINSGQEENVSTNWFAGILLFVYAICFSFAYTMLNVSAGALILFGSVQITFFIAGYFRGERPTLVGAMGIAVAMGGVIYLALPSLDTPAIGGALLMFVSGLAMAFYSIFGKSARAPLMTTAKNFLVTIPLVLVMSVVTLGQGHLTVAGVILAVASGAYASGVGYVFWYSVLPRLTFFQASSSQFAVPVLASLAGIALLGEPLTPHFVIATLLILAGTTMTLLTQTRQDKHVIEPS